ncbi:CgeB family protein [Roseibium salinum]|uniref:Glycosyltransferase n=1 Tax=Roseibium salinum TaxID=1604349 RepID=A0ABT3QX78_9HYPH|nr:glycosyltransferase [Roseibium sp. DSM 29163]MCX2721448.1 glycosyltransferase [Roseibium sp. DSM 29163]MDN3721922.1 glycosyltransferase [Roseibium salinum]
MKIAFYGSSILSTYWNGAATYYRGLIRALSELGHDITFFEPDVYDRQKHRDLESFDWCKVVIYDGNVHALRSVAAMAARADVVIKASGVGYEDDLLLSEIMKAARPDALKIFWDVDAPATLAEMQSDADHPLRRTLPRLDLVLTYGGGDPVVGAYRALGASACIPIYNALDPIDHHPVLPEPRFEADLAFLGNRLPDREERVDRFFLYPAAQNQDLKFLLGGAGWEDKAMSSNVRYIGHVPATDHNAFNATPKAVLNISRSDMARTGFSPATRVFEAAGARACLITDYWEGIERFLKPGEEVLVARDGKDVADLIGELTPERAEQIGKRALARVIAEHTYAHRAVLVDSIFRNYFDAFKGAMA